MDELPLRFEGRPAGLRAKGKGPVVLFAHPFPLDGSCWTEMIDRCAAAGLRGAAVDAPGFGRTPALGRACTMDDLARLLAGALDALAAPSATLVGCSMGGYAIFAFQRLFPDRLDRALLICTKATPDSDAARAKREEQAQAALAHGPEAVTGELVPKMVSPRSPPEVLARVRALASAATAQGIADALRGMALRPDSTPDLPRWRAFAMALAGADDQLIPPAEAEAIARAIPGAIHASIAGAGHRAFLEKPNEVWTALTVLQRGGF
jgi:pimeloyl-ACP methyl ester carboxylesterase